MPADLNHQCKIEVEDGFSLRDSAGPIAWAGGRSPRAAITGDTVLVIDRDASGIIARRLRQAGGSVHIESNASSDAHHDWLRRTFRPHSRSTEWEDPVIASLARRFPGLHPYTDGSLFAGLVTSIIGQSISIASAMSVQRRLSLSFTPGMDIDGRVMAPLPTAEDLAEASTELIRASGVTWKRAEGLQAIAREQLNGHLPSGFEDDPNALQRTLVELPIVGPWTAASALLWGVGAPDAWPKGDVALLRAARLAYDCDGMTMRDLDELAEGWRPFRAIAARLLWTGLLGPGWPSGTPVETRRERA